MTLGRTSTGAIKIKTDSPGLRAVECGCCVQDCPECEDSPYGIVITPEQYNKFKQGGEYTMSATLYESQTLGGTTYGPCSVTLNGSGSLMGNCSFAAEARQNNYCTDGMPFFPDAYLRLNWYVCKETTSGLYKFRWQNSGFYSGACPYPISWGGPPFCYSAGFNINEGFDTYPPTYFAQVGTITINNRGAQVQVGVWAFPPQTGFNSSASATITIT